MKVKIILKNNFNLEKTLPMKLKRNFKKFGIKLNKTFQMLKN